MLEGEYFLREVLINSLYKVNGHFDHILGYLCCTRVMYHYQKSQECFQNRFLSRPVCLGGFRGLGRTAHSVVEVRGGFMPSQHGAWPPCMAIASDQAVVEFKLSRLLYSRLNVHKKSYV